MEKVLRIFCLMLLSLHISCNTQSNKGNKMDFEDEKYRSGQIWQYETRKGEEQSRVIILKVERSLKEEVVVHIAVLNARIKNPQKEGGISTEIAHLPFSRESMDKSLTKLESSNNELPDYIDGYNQWKKAFETGRGGIFTIGVKEAVDYVEQAMNQ